MSDLSNRLRDKIEEVQAEVTVNGEVIEGELDETIETDSEVREALEQLLMDQEHQQQHNAYYEDGYDAFLDHYSAGVEEDVEEIRETPEPEDAFYGAWMTGYRDAERELDTMAVIVAAYELVTSSGSVDDTAVALDNLERAVNNLGTLDEILHFWNLLSKSSEDDA